METTWDNMRTTGMQRPHGVSVVSTCCLRGLHMLSLWSPHRPCHLHVVPIIPTLSRRSPHHPKPPRHPLHPPPLPWGWGPQISKNTISTITNRDILILLKDLKSVETPPPMGGRIGLWVDGWVNGWGQVKSLQIE